MPMCIENIMAITLNLNEDMCSSDKRVYKPENSNAPISYDILEIITML